MAIKICSQSLVILLRSRNDILKMCIHGYFQLRTQQRKHCRIGLIKEQFPKESTSPSLQNYSLLLFERRSLSSSKAL